VVRIDRKAKKWLELIGSRRAESRHGPVLEVEPEAGGEGPPPGRGELDGALPLHASHPAGIEQHGQEAGAELAGQVVALLAPVQAEPQQRPTGRAAVGGEQVRRDAEACEDLGRGRSEDPGVIRKLAGKPVVGPAAGIGEPVGRRQGPVVDEGLGELDAELSSEVVVAGAGRTQRRRASGLPQDRTGCWGASWASAGHFVAALRWLGVAAAIGWLLVAVLIYSVAREPGSGR
jgi:hypothetical protein